LAKAFKLSVIIRVKIMFFMGIILIVILI